MFAIYESERENSTSLQFNPSIYHKAHISYMNYHFQLKYEICGISTGIFAIHKS